MDPVGNSLNWSEVPDSASHSSVATDAVSTTTIVECSCVAIVILLYLGLSENREQWYVTPVTDASAGHVRI